MPKKGAGVQYYELLAPLLMLWRLWKLTWHCRSVRLGKRLADPLFPFKGPCSPSPPVLANLEAPEDCPACLWWFPLRELREGPNCEIVPRRGSETCEEGEFFCRLSGFEYQF